MSTFHFYTRITEVELLGRSAKNVKELMLGIEQVPAMSIYHHTHRYLEQHHHFSPEHPNDFSYWVTTSLGLKKLGEIISSVDLFSFSDVEDLRKKFAEILNNYIKVTPHLRNCIPGEEFRFLSSKIFVVPTHFVANNLGEFVDCLEKVTIHSIYFHVFEARLRFKKADNDFSCWLRDQGFGDLAGEISRFDPYTHTLDGVRKRISRLIRNHIR